MITTCVLRTERWAVEAKATAVSELYILGVIVIFTEVLNTTCENGLLYGGTAFFTVVWFFLLFFWLYVLWFVCNKAGVVLVRLYYKIKGKFKREKEVEQES